ISVQPTWPPAPPLFTTIIGCPSSFSAIEATMRAPTSVEPPGGYATMSCTGLLGKFCAPALTTAEESAKAAPVMTMTMRDFMTFLLLVACRSRVRFTHFARRQLQDRANQNGGREQQQSEA